MLVLVQAAFKIRCTNPGVVQKKNESQSKSRLVMENGCMVLVMSALQPKEGNQDLGLQRGNSGHWRDTKTENHKNISGT